MSTDCPDVTSTNALYPVTFCLEPRRDQHLRLSTRRLKPVSSQNHTWKSSDATCPAFK